MSGCVRGRNKEVDAAFNKAFVVVAELGARHFLQAIGKAPAFELVLKYPIAFVVKQAWHGEPPWPDQKSGRIKKPFANSVERQSEIIPPSGKNIGDSMDDSR